MRRTVPPSAEIDYQRGLRNWRALDEATDARDGNERVQGLVSELERAGYTAAAR